MILMGKPFFVAAFWARVASWVEGWKTRSASFLATRPVCESAPVKATSLNLNCQVPPSADDPPESEAVTAFVGSCRA